MLPLLFVLAAGAGAPAESLPCSEGASAVCEKTLSVGQMFDLAEQLAGTGQREDAVKVLSLLSEDNAKEVRAEARARLARLATAQGDLWGAVNLYRQLLEEVPDAAAVRIELAQILVRLGDEAAAGRQLRLAQAAGLPDPVSRSLRRATEFLQTKKPFGFDLSIGIAPDTNINGATEAASVAIQGLEFSLDRDGRARSGIGLTYLAQATFRQTLNPQLRWITQARSEGSLYKEARFNDVGVSIESGPEATMGRVTLWPTIIAGRRYYRSEHLYEHYGASVAGTVGQGRKAQIAFGGSWLRFDYAPSYWGRSGSLVSGRIGYDRALSSRLIVHAGLNVTQATAKDPTVALDGIGFDLAARRDLGPVSILLQGGARKAQADGVDPLFAQLRRDHRYDGSIGIIARKISWHGLSPQVKAIYTHNNSTLPIYQYRRMRGEITLTGTF